MEFLLKGTLARSKNIVNDILTQSTSEVMAIALEYSQLASSPNPSDEECDRLSDILTMATNNDTLNFWLTEVDHCLGHHLGLLNEDHRDSYMDQQSLLREHRGEMICIVPSQANKQIPACLR
jgi:predicted MPP superfamily phosphohydrolase